MSPPIVATPISWAEAAPTELKNVKGICMDIDETLSTRGKLTDQAFSALWALKRAGFILVPVTGRPAGWCDHIARFWPVDAVIGENGAFTFFMQGGVRRRLETPGAAEDGKLKLAQLSKKILEKFPKARFASDQSYREFDLAIDICEDVSPWPQSDIDELLELCAAEGAHAKLSSIHVNTWFGEFDKRRGFEHWLSRGVPGEAPDVSQWLFIGDSPNDEPLFKSFDYSVGVANLKTYLGRLAHPPRWVTAAESGAGFAEMANKMILAKMS